MSLRTIAQAAKISRNIGAGLRKVRLAKGLTVWAVCKASGVSALAEVEAGDASLGEMGDVARALGVNLVALAQEVESSRFQVDAEVETTQTIEIVANAIVCLNVKGSKVDAAVDAAVIEAMNRAGSNQSAAARLLGMERKAFVRRFARARRAQKARR